MRIAMIGCRGLPAGTGGVERVVEAVSDELTARGHEVLVYSRRHYVGDLPGPPQIQRIITPGLAGKHLDTFTHTATATCDVLRRGVDLVHIHSPGPALWSWLPALARLPIVLTVHAPDWRRAKWSTGAKLMLRVGLALGMRTAAAVTAVSRPLAEELSRRYGRRVEYIPNAPSALSSSGGESVEAMGLTPGRYGLYVGRIVPEKRLDVLLRAWREAGADVPLVVVGHVGEDPYGRRCRELGFECVRFVGEQLGPALAALYANAAMVVQPSVLEGMSLVLLEAAAAGRCILAARTPEAVDTLEDNAEYFESDNIGELSSLIRRCLEEEALRSQKGRQARRYVEAHYSWPSAVDRLEAVYRQAVQGRT